MLPVRLHKKRGNKYGARKVKLDGHTFDSQAEARRYGQLVTMARAGLITDLVVHPKFTIEINGSLICKVILDFSYKDKRGEIYYEDVKGFRTREFVIKKNLMAACHGIDVVEIRAKRTEINRTSRGNK